MIDYIKGEITALNPTYAVLETAGIGYFINISLPTYSVLLEQKNATLFVYEAIREDAHSLYGFLQPTDRKLFLMLISVSGIGANTARMIMSSYAVPEIQHMIATEDVSALSSIKGIGAKTAQRIIVDLKDKIIKLVDISETSNTHPLITNETKEEAVSALVMLGFASSASQKAVDNILKKQPDIRVEQLIKLALKNM